MTASTRSTTSVLSRITDVLELCKIDQRSNTSVNLDKTEVEDLVDAVIFEPVAPRDHFPNGRL